MSTEKNNIFRSFVIDKFPKKIYSLLNGKVEIIMDGFGARLKKLRREADITQSALAKYLGVVPSAVGKYELYSKSYPSIEALLKISDFFHVSTDYLLKGVEPGCSNSGVNNGAIVQTNNGSVAINSKPVSLEAMELVKIYEKLNGRERLRLLNFAVEMEAGDTQDDNRG